MRAVAALLVGVVATSTACGGAAPPPPQTESTAFVQDPTRPNITYGIEGTVEGAPELGLKDGREITLDGQPVADARRALEQKKSSSGRLAYAFDRDTPWSQVRGLLGTAAKAGYPHAAFVTRVVRESVSHPSHLDVEVATEKKTSADRTLHVTLSSKGAVMLRWMEGPKQIGVVVSADAAVPLLAPAIEREWTERGLYHESNDKRVDQVSLHVEPDTPYILVITVLDAISGTKKGSAPAFTVNLPADDKTPDHAVGSKRR